MDNEETIEELRAALAELESGEGLSRFVEGHGLQSRFFAFSWKSEGLSIDFNLPCGRVLSDEEEQALDAARVGAALRMAILLLTAADGGKLLFEGEALLSVARTAMRSTPAMAGMRSSRGSTPRCRTATKSRSSGRNLLRRHEYSKYQTTNRNEENP